MCILKFLKKQIKYINSIRVIDIIAKIITKLKILIN